jgi:hypothetical protein
VTRSNFIRRERIQNSGGILKFDVLRLAEPRSGFAARRREFACAAIPNRKS